MVIGEPVQVVPHGKRVAGQSKYAPAFDAAVAARGAWVPIEFETPREANLFFNSAKQFTRRAGRYAGMEATKRGLAVYVRMPTLRSVAV